MTAPEPTRTKPGFFQSFDHVVASLGLCAYVALATWTESYVFTALTGLLFAVAVDWARRRRRDQRARDVAVTGITNRIGPA